MSERMIFCLGNGRWERSGEGYQKNLRIFNVDVTEEEYNKVKSSLDTKNFKLPLKELWKEFTQEEKDFFTSIPHFNKDIFKKITGIDVEEEPAEMTLEAVCKALGKVIKIVK